MPIRPRQTPPVIPSRRDHNSTEGRFYLRDARTGTHMRGLRPDEVKFLRVIESPEKRSFTDPGWGGQGLHAPAMNWHNFENKRILGTVPVEEDGSVYLSVPAGKYVYFQLLDADRRMVQSMRSGTIVQPGETQGCVGCHDSRSESPLPHAGTMALRHPPRRLDGWFGPAREFSFLTEVQPVFDRHCVSCHDFGKSAGKHLILAGDRELVFNAAYTELWSKGLVHCIGAGPAEVQIPKSWGSHASKLTRFLRPEHHRVKLHPDEIQRVETWMDLNAPYYPKYESGQPGGAAGRSPLTQGEATRLQELGGVALTQPGFQTHRLWISFDRPELSPLLDRCAAGSPREEALSLIRAGGERLRAQPRGDTAGFTMSPADRIRHERLNRLRLRDAAFQKAIREGRKLKDENIIAPQPPHDPP